MIQRQRRDRLDGTAWPDDRHLAGSAVAPEAEQQLLRVLREEARARGDDAGDASALGLDRHARADRVAVALRPTQAKGDQRAWPAAKSLRNSRSCGDDRGAIRTTSGVAVAVEVEHRERRGRPGRGRARRAPDTSSKPPWPSLRSSTLRSCCACAPSLTSSRLVGAPAVVVGGARRALAAATGRPPVARRSCRRRLPARRRRA